MSNVKRQYWTQLFGRHHAGLTAFIRRRVRRTTDAHDLAQEAYVRFLRADRNELIRNPEAYLYTVAVNLIREQGVLERRWTSSVDAAESPVDPALIDLRTPEEELDAAARLSRISGMIDALPPKLRTVLILQYRDGMTYEQIAQQLGVTTHAVKKYVMTALALCRRQVKEQGGAS